MHNSLGSGSVRLLVHALTLAAACTVVAVGCGSSSSGGGSAKAGETGIGEGGDGNTSGTGGKSGGSAGKGAGGKSGTAGGAGEAGDMGEGGEAPVAQNHSAVAFVSSGAISKSKNFILISGTGESLGGTVGSKQSKSLKYTYVPGVIAASAN